MTNCFSSTILSWIFFYVTGERLYFKHPFHGEGLRREVSVRLKDIKSIKEHELYICYVWPFVYSKSLSTEINDTTKLVEVDDDSHEWSMSPSLRPYSIRKSDLRCRTWDHLFSLSLLEWSSIQYSHETELPDLSTNLLRTFTYLVWGFYVLCTVIEEERGRWEWESTTETKDKVLLYFRWSFLKGHNGNGVEGRMNIDMDITDGRKDNHISPETGSGSGSGDNDVI